MRVGKLKCPVPPVPDVGKERPNLFKNLVNGGASSSPRTSIGLVHGLNCPSPDPPNLSST